MAVKINNTTVIDDSRNATFLGLESTTLPLLVSGQMVAHAPVDVIPSGITYPIDCSLGNYFTISISSDPSIIKISNPPVGAYAMTISIINDFLDHTLVWPTNIKSLPSLILASATLTINLFTVTGGDAWITSIESYR